MLNTIARYPIAFFLPNSLLRTSCSRRFSYSSSRDKRTLDQRSKKRYRLSRTKNKIKTRFSSELFVPVDQNSVHFFQLASRIQTIFVTDKCVQWPQLSLGRSAPDSASFNYLEHRLLADFSKFRSVKPKTGNCVIFFAYSSTVSNVCRFRPMISVGQNFSSAIAILRLGTSLRLIKDRRSVTG